MKSFLNIIKYDYLQRTRTYAFLVTVCCSLALAYTFVPEPNANYSTIRIADHLGYYNSAWFGYVTALMTSVFLSLVGFYLVNSGIKSDIETKVGQIVAATPIKNIKYLLGKTLSNFMVLLTIVCIVFAMSIFLFFLYNDGYPFELVQFITPYVIIVVPTIFFVSVIAVVFEVIFSRYSIVQNIGFFILFSAFIIYTPKSDTHFTFDVFGSKIVTSQMESTVRTLTGVDEKQDMSIGYVLGNIEKSKKFEFNGVNFPVEFILSRIVWICVGFVLIFLIAPIFHRFDIKRVIKEKIEKTKVIFEKSQREIVLSTLPQVEFQYSILPFVKTELVLLFRKGKKWVWGINLIGMVLLAVLPLQTAHQFVLPVLWFFQVGRLSELSSKEIRFDVHYFAFSSFKPLSRLLVSQLLAGSILMITLAIPLIIRFVLAGNLEVMLTIIVGGIGLVFLGSTLGIISKGKKLFEVLFFMIAYSNINGIVFMDYFGALPHDSMYLLRLILFTMALAVSGFLVRNYQLRN